MQGFFGKSVSEGVVWKEKAREGRLKVEIGSF